MKFNSAEEMLKLIQSDKDLYNPELEIYVFVYNDAGSICEYDLDNDQAIAVALFEAAKKVEYWGGSLSLGGHIYDPPRNIERVKTYFDDPNWMTCGEYLDRMGAKLEGNSHEH